MADGASSAPAPAPAPTTTYAPRRPNFDGSARTPRSAQVYGINTGRTLRSLIPPYRLT